MRESQKEETQVIYITCPICGVTYAQVRPECPMCGGDDGY